MHRFLVATLIYISACGGTKPQSVSIESPATASPIAAGMPPPLRVDLPWTGNNRDTLIAWMDEFGSASKDYNADKKPVALFDFDGTLLEGDIGDAITHHLIATGNVLQPPNKDWKRTSKYLTTAAAAALSAACGTAVQPGAKLPTNTNVACADEMLSIYHDNKTRSGQTAFAGGDRRRMEPAYAWTAQLAAGHTPAEISTMVRDLATKMLGAPRDTKYVVGTRSVVGWLRFYDQTRDLLHGLQTRGYDVWIITASPNPVVAAISTMVGVAPEKVVGIRQLLDANGRLTYSFEGCGTVADGDDSLITYVEGKRCWVNKVVYGDAGKNAMDRRPAVNRQVFGIGDSSGDVAFLLDAKYKFVRKNPKAKDMMCFAYHNENNSWVIEAMSPQATLAPVSLACSTTACRDATGAGQPCRDESGKVVPDQNR